MFIMAAADQKNPHISWWKTPDDQPDVMFLFFTHMTMNVFNLECKRTENIQTIHKMKTHHLKHINFLSFMSAALIHLTFQFHTNNDV